MLLPVASLFVACKDDDGYNLNNLKTDFEKIETSNSNVKLVDGEIQFDYSNHEYLQETINNKKPYTTLNDYNYIFNNLMAFACNYIEVCSNNNIEADASVKNEVKSTLNELINSIKDVDACVDMLGEIISVSNYNVLELACLTRYENLLDTYDEMFESAINFNNALSNLYFNYALRDANPNITEKSVEEFDANVVINKLESRVNYQISALSQSFVEMYIDGGILAEKIVNQEVNFNINIYNYKTNVDSIRKVFDEQTAAEIVNNGANKESFYNLAVQAYNIQETMNNDKEKFVTACNAIDYSVVKASASVNAHQQLCVDIIESNYELISTYNSALVEMLYLMGV